MFLKRHERKISRARVNGNSVAKKIYKHTSGWSVMDEQGAKRTVGCAVIHKS